jgi:hypothetical protein
MAPEARPPDRAYEFEDPRLGPLLAVAVSVILFILSGITVSAILQQSWARNLPIDPAHQFIIAPNETPFTRFPHPALQIDPRLDLLALRQREDTELNSYGWLDQSNGVVRIPITRAMTLFQQRAASQTNANSSAPSRSPLQLIQERATKR